MTESVRIEDLKDKYVFWDIDGTLAPYRFNNHLSNPDDLNDNVNGMSLREIKDGIFIQRKPSQHMQKVITQCLAKENIILGHCNNDLEKVDKKMWLSINFSTITEYLIISQKISKADTILQYCKDKNIELKDVIFVDDVLSFLREAEIKGITSYHISSFLDWDYQFTE